MGRLIDADELLQKFESSKIQPTKDTDEFIDGWCEGFNTVVDMIRNQPTAYDVESVVAELENEIEWAKNHGTSEDFRKGRISGLRTAIRVAGNGGVK